jgi:hypothetical protein
MAAHQGLGGLWWLAPSSPWIGSTAPCSRTYPQVAQDREHRSYGVTWANTRGSTLEEPRQEEQRQEQADQAGDQASDSHAKARRVEPLAPPPQVPGPKNDGDQAEQERWRAQHAQDQPAMPKPSVATASPLPCLRVACPSSLGRVAIWASSDPAVAACHSPTATNGDLRGPLYGAREASTRPHHYFPERARPTPGSRGL